jgi:hypothetical protein
MLKNQAGRHRGLPYRNANASNDHVGATPVIAPRSRGEDEGGGGTAKLVEAENLLAANGETCSSDFTQ